MRMRIFGRNPRTHADDTFDHSYLCGVHLHCHALHYFPTMDGYTEMCGFQYFTPLTIQHLAPAPAIMSPSPRILNLRHAKNFQTCVPSAHESVSALLSKWLWQRYTVYGFRLHSSLRGRQIADTTDDIQTGGGVRSLHALSDTDYCMIVLVFGKWQYRVIVVIAQHLTCVELSTHSSLLSHSRPTSLAEWQYKAGFQPKAGRVCNADQKNQNKQSVNLHLW